MEEETEEKSKGFKVQDRRRFSAEGELKPEHQDEGSSAGTSQSDTSTTGPAEHKPHREEGARDNTAETAHKDPSPSPDITFGAFVVSLSTQALFHLGEMPDPVTNERERDLPSAQQVIDILGMLREKTRGNLDRDEEGLLDSILFDLRMKYVEIARRNPRT
jgi:hypothetical protein